MLPARLERIEVDARRTAREINDRRELLDWFLNARKELADHKANMAAQEEAEARAPSAVSDARNTTAASGRSAPGTAGTGLLRSGSASRMGAEVIASPTKLKPGSASTGSLIPMGPVNVGKSMHARCDALVLLAERNARELAERRPTLDSFKDIKMQMAEAKAKKNGGKTFSMADPLPPGTFLRTTGSVQKLSYNSRCNFAQNYSLQPLHEAVKEIAPPHPVHPTTSMKNRLEACEHRVLWNHQTMTHNQNFLDDYGRFARGEV